MIDKLKKKSQKMPIKKLKLKEEGTMKKLNLREEILSKVDNNSTNVIITEMARKELLTVIDLIKSGELDKAAEAYVKNGGNPLSSAVGKTVNSYIRKEGIEDEELKKKFQSFKSAVAKYVATQGIDTGRAKKYKKDTTTGKTKEGKTVTAPKGQDNIKRVKRGQDRLAKEQAKHLKQMKQIESGNIEDQKAVALDITKTWGRPKNQMEDEVYTLLKNFAETGENQEQAITVMKKVLEGGKEALDALRKGSVAALAGKISLKRKPMKEEMTIREKMLMEATGYYGDNFWDNYILSHLVRTFAKDMQEFGEETAISMYTAVYGKQTEELFEYMAENDEMLFEAAKIEGIFLFEDIGEKNLYEAGLLFTAASGIGGGGRSAISKFLGGLWGKLKDVGRQAFSKITPFLQKGFTWAKELVKKGASWFATSPIGKVAIPAILTAGSLVTAIKLINKMRKKAGKKEMTPQEKEALEKVVERNRQKIERYKQMAETEKANQNIEG